MHAVTFHAVDTQMKSMSGRAKRATLLVIIIICMCGFAATIVMIFAQV